MSALRKAGAEIIECHVPLFRNAEQKARVAQSTGALLRMLLQTLVCYMRLSLKFFALAPYDVLIVGYGGLCDPVVARLLSVFRRRPIVYDAFLSVYDSVVHDRKLCKPRSPKAWLFWWYDALLCRCADAVLLDTAAHIAYFVQEFGIPPSKFIRVWIGSDKEHFRVPTPERPRQVRKLKVLFWGTFIPLHGLETIVQAAHKLQDRNDLCITIIGNGQIENEIKALAARQPANVLEFLPAMPYDELVPRIIEADICLGIFGATKKTQRVIPCKVYECLYFGKPTITADTPAAAELLTHGTNVWLVPCSDPDALAVAIEHLAADSRLRERLCAGARELYRRECCQLSIGTSLLRKLSGLILDGKECPHPLSAKSKIKAVASSSHER